MANCVSGDTASTDVYFERTIPGLGTEFQENPLAGGGGQSPSRRSTGSPHIFNPPAALQRWLRDSASCLTMGRRIPAAAEEEEALCVAASLLHRRGA